MLNKYKYIYIYVCIYITIRYPPVGFRVAAVVVLIELILRCCSDRGLLLTQSNIQSLPGSLIRELADSDRADVAGVTLAPGIQKQIL